MVFLIIIGTFIYFMLPQLLVSWLLKRYDYMIYKWDADVYIIGWGLAFIQLALLIQIFVWCIDYV